jgi:hypothetical protein
MRMRNWKSIAGGLVAAFALFILGGSTFLSVVVLQWLLWRFIVPATSAVPAELTSLFRARPRRGFFTGTIAFGYLHVACYCVHLSGYVPSVDKRDIGFLVIGLVLIGLCTAARLRDVFAALSAPPERQPTST